MAIEGGDIGDKLNPTLDVAGEEEDDDEDENATEDQEEEEEEEEEYTFRFENGMSPLAFIDNNDHAGVQRYLQQFERLADKKRKALSQSHPEATSIKKARENDDDDISRATMAEIMELMNHGVGRRSRKLKKRGGRKGSKNKRNPQITRMQGDANLHYACGRYDQAIPVLHEVVRLAPNVFDSYHTLGLIYSKLEDCKRATDFYMIAAHLTPKCSSFWEFLIPGPKNEVISRRPVIVFQKQ